MLLLKLNKLVGRVRDDESGAPLAEYAVLLVIVAVAGIVGAAALGTALQGAFTAMGTWVTTNLTSVLSNDFS